MKKLLALLLALVMLTGACTGAFAESYSERAMTIMDLMVDAYEAADSDEERKAACAYGVVYLMAELVNQLDTDGIATHVVEDILSTMEEEDTKAATRTDQLVNAFNRMVEMSGALEIVLDKDNSNLEVVQAIYGSFAEYLDPAKDSVDLMANASYRTFEQLVLAADELNDGGYTEFISEVYNDFVSDDEYCETYMHQLINGVYSCAMIFCVIACELDADESCRDLILDAVESMWADDEAAVNADGQVIVGLFGIGEFILITCLDLDGNL